MANLIRTQIMLEKNQRDQLNEIAKSSGVSFSELVRDFLNAQIRMRRYEKMQKAAEQLYDDYMNDPELTSMTAMDGEDFANE